MPVVLSLPPRFTPDFTLNLVLHPARNSDESGALFIFCFIHTNVRYVLRGDLDYG